MSANAQWHHSITQMHALLTVVLCVMCAKIFVLTDGAVNNTDAVLQLVKKHAHHTRVFAFGVGSKYVRVQ